jgi:drug/metabolite transporter (DMT)-like permease
MLGTAVSFALMAGLIKVAGRSYNPFEVVFFRGLVAWVGVLVLERVTTGRIARGENRRGLFLRAAFGMAALLLYVLAITRVDLGLANALNLSSPLFVALLSIPLLNERPGPVRWALVVVGFAGVWLILSPDLSDVNLYALGGLASGALSGVAYSLVRSLRGSDGPLTIVRWFSMWVAILVLPLAVAWGWTWPDAMGVAVLGAMGLLALAGQVLLTIGYRNAPAAAISPVMYLQVPLSLLIGVVGFGELPTPAALGGVALLLVSTVLLARFGDGG